MTILVVDANVFIDLIIQNKLGYLFFYGKLIYTSSEILCHLNDSDMGKLNSFIQSNQLIIINVSADEFNEMNSIEFPKGFDYCDKIGCYLASKNFDVVLYNDVTIGKYCKVNYNNVQNLTWIDSLITGTLSLF